jgi:hypothetical protein
MQLVLVDDRVGVAVEGDQDSVVERGEDQVVGDRGRAGWQRGDLGIPFDLARPADLQNALAGLLREAEGFGSRPGSRDCVCRSYVSGPSRAPPVS